VQIDEGRDESVLECADENILKIKDIERKRGVWKDET
jgi:hypothetical protein